MDPIIRMPIVSPRARQLVRPTAPSADIGPATQVHVEADYGPVAPKPVVAPDGRQADDGAAEQAAPRVTYGQSAGQTAGQPAYGQPTYDALLERQALDALRAQQESRAMTEQQRVVEQQRVEEQRRLEEEQQTALALEQEVEDIRKDAEERGFAAGLEQAEEAVKKAVSEQVERLASIAALLVQAKADILESAEDVLVEIVYTALCRIIGASMTIRTGAAVMVKHVLAELQQRDQLTIRLHPHDVALVQAVLDGPDAPLASETALRADAAIELGGCIVDSATGSLDARLETQLQRLRDTLLQVRTARVQDEGTA